MKFIYIHLLQSQKPSITKHDYFLGKKNLFIVSTMWQEVSNQGNTYNTSFSHLQIEKSHFKMAFNNLD